MSEVNVENIEAEVKTFVCEEWGVGTAKVKRETSFIDDLKADSLELVELVMELEEIFNIEIPDEDAKKILTVGDAIDYIASAVPKNSNN